MSDGTEKREGVVKARESNIGAADSALANGASAETPASETATEVRTAPDGMFDGVGQRPASMEPEEPRVEAAFRQRLSRVAPWIMATFTVILIGMLALLLSDTRTTDAAVRPTPTATPAPTATPMPTSTPAPIDGFQFYRDPANHFIIQYPLGWTVSSDTTSQGIEFCDDCNNPGYIVQVNTPSNLGEVGPPANQNTASAWVTYALNGLASRLQSGTLTPIGEQQPITIGGVVWQSGGGLVTDSGGSVRFKVQVYATVYEGKPYILVLSTSDDRFTAGTIQFFGPMLQSFQFAPQTPQNP